MTDEYKRIIEAALRGIRLPWKLYKNAVTNLLAVFCFAEDQPRLFHQFDANLTIYRVNDRWRRYYEGG